ncbi:MAG TPA: OmpW family outer membrane protein [Thermoanaerobaculia bacterium]
MRYTVAAVLALSLTLPAVAQNRFFVLTGSVVWADPSGDGTFEDLPTTGDLQFDNATGWGVDADIFIGDRLSLDFAGSVTQLESTLSPVPPGAEAGGVDMIPLTGIVRFHLLPNSVIDPYIGGGAAYVLLEESDDGISGLDSLDFDDDVGFVVNAGVGIKLGSRFGLNVDAKYVPLEANATAVVVGGSGTTEGKVDISPFIVSAGLSLRF